MSGQIAHALEDAAKKAEQGLAKDFSTAYHDILKDTEHGVGKVADHVAENEARTVEDLGKAAEHPGSEPHVGDPHAGPGTPARGEHPGAGPGKEEPDLGAGEPGGGQGTEGNGSCQTGGDPVDVVSGQMITTETDLELPGLLPVVLLRAYASGYVGGTLFGPGWSATLTQRVQIDRQGIHYAGDDGQILHYPVPTQPGQQVHPEDGARWPLVWDRADDTILIHDPETGWTRHFPVPAHGMAGPRPIAALTDRNGHRVEFLLDESGLPKEVRHSGGYRVAVDIVHTSAGPRVEALRLLDGTEGGLGTTVRTFGYDVFGRLTDVINSSGMPLVYGYDEHDRITSWTDRNGHWYAYEYGDDGRVARGHGPEGALAATFDYELDSRTTRVTDSLGNTTTYHYDEQQHVTAVVDPLGGVVRTEFDRYGQLLTHTDALGHTTRYTYDAHGNVTSIDRPDGTRVTARYNQLGLPELVTTPDGREWQQVFDVVGNRTALVDPFGAVTAFAYDEQGRPLHTVDPLGHTTQFRCNPAGLVTETCDAQGSVTRLVLDAFGRTTALTEADGRTTRSTWSGDGQLVSRTWDDGTTESWTYDAEGNPLSHTDPAGAVERFEYGHFDLLTAKTFADGSRVAFAYDTELRLTQVTDAQGLDWTYTYDALGQVRAETDFNGSTSTYDYDAVGRLTRSVNGAGQATEYAYDPMSRPVEKTVDGQSTVFAYDPGGRLLSATSPLCRLARQYDDAAATVTETVNGRTFTAGYDRLGRRTHRRTPSGAESSWSYDQVGNITALVASGQTIAFEHDPLGRETRRRFADGLTLDARWDGQDRLTGRSLTRRGDASPLHARTYAYRADGRPTRLADLHTGARDLDLDQAGRVTAVRGTDWSETYTYDRAGRLTDAAWPTRRGAAQGTRDYRGTLVVRAGRTRYEYDGHGRVISRKTTTLSGRTDTWNFTWNGEDRLTHLTTPDGSVWSYDYDPLGRRISKQHLDADGVTVIESTTFTWDGAALAEQTAHSPQLPGPYTLTWDYRDLQPIAQRERISPADADHGLQGPDDTDQRFFAVITDLVGAPTHLIAPDGTTAWESRTVLWGAASTRTGASTRTPLRYPGQYYDPESHLHYNFHRYYDPDTGRYLSPDPLGLDPAPDSYAYVDNPLAEIDPLGLAKRCPNVVIERYGNEAEAKASQQANGLVLKPAPHDKQPKWVAKNGTVKGQRLGKPSMYTHKMEFTCKPGVLEWLKQYEIKSNEPDRYAIPADKVDEFNKFVVSTKTINQKRKK